MSKDAQESEDAQERRHFLEVVQSYNEYSAHGVGELVRRKRHMLALPADQLTRLPAVSSQVICRCL